MRVIVDCRCLQSPPPRGGVGVFADQIVRALLRVGNQESARPDRSVGGIGNHGIEWSLFANGLFNPRRHLPQFDASNVRWHVTRWPNKLFNAGSLFPLPSSLFPAADVLFLPNLNFVPRLPRDTRLVVTVHDLSFEHFPEFFTVRQRLWHRFVRPRALLHRADAIIAVSETTKRDVVETYGVPEGKVHVVYPGISRESSVVRREHVDQTTTRSEVPTSYILTVSELSPRKNIDGLIAAFEQLTTLLPYPSTTPLHLVIAGKDGSARRAIERQIARSPVRDRIHLLGPVTENEKRALLARASCFVYLSIWEGFGFPPLEAMAAGIPVVASTGGALPEVLGDAALLVDPLDPTAIANAIGRVCTDHAFRSTLIARGRAHAERYSWETAARSLASILVSKRSPENPRT
ncbi:glycosyltransferase family 4 protein [Candidatus Uhrbacteria bacterium]|nr:glycosyltransferase family 4 protein [Candidatus Uhrbacteria bacterium]